MRKILALGAMITALAILGVTGCNSPGYYGGQPNRTVVYHSQSPYYVPNSTVSVYHSYPRRVVHVYHSYPSPVVVHHYYSRSYSPRSYTRSYSRRR